MGKALRRAVAVICLLGAVFFLLPLAAGILHFGMVWPAAVLLLAAAVLLWPAFFRRLLRPKWLRGLVGCLAAVCLTVVLVTLGKMAQAAAQRPADSTPCTVVVLGCQVFPDGHPSLVLRGRIQAAYDYLSRHPEAVCVASGGQNDSEPITEAACIRDTLAEMGIDPARIYLEDKSTSTEENLAFSAQVIAENGLPATGREMGRAPRLDALLVGRRQPVVSAGGLLGAGGGGAGVYGHHGEIVLKNVDLWEDG